MTRKWDVDSKGNVLRATQEELDEVSVWKELAEYQRVVGLKYDDLVNEPTFWVEFQNLITEHGNE